MKTVMCIGAHPDDIEFVCAGTLLQWQRQGHEVVLVVLTNGENGYKAGDLPPAERAAIRRREQLAAARELGLREVVFCDHRDGFLAASEDLRAHLVALVREHRPEIVFAFDPANRDFDDLNLFHRDHRVAAELSFDAVFAAKNRWMYPGEPHRVGEIWFFGSHAPDRWVDITDDIDRKLAILRCHASQFGDHARLERLVREELSGPHGAARHSEAFRVLRVRQVI